MTELPAGMTPRWHKTPLTIGHSRACSAKHSQIAVWRWQIPSFVSADVEYSLHASNQATRCRLLS